MIPGRIGPVPARIAAICAAFAVLAAPAVGACGASDPAVQSYPAAYFAAQRPQTALDMVQRLPGFTFSEGNQSRGLAGSAGNVLIDGQRPANKQDMLSDILTRIPASTVERIDVVRGASSSLDMQGQTVIANVIRLDKTTRTAAVTISDTVTSDDGRHLPMIKLEGAVRAAARSFEGSLTVERDPDVTVGPGPHHQFDAQGHETYGAHLAAQADLVTETATGAYEQPLAGGKLRVTALASASTYADREADTVAFPAGDDDRYAYDQTTQNGELGVHYDRDFGARARLETIVLQQVQHVDQPSRYQAPGDDEQLRTQTTLAESTARATLRYQRSSRLTFEAAVEGAYNIQDASNRYRINGVEQVLPAADTRVQELRGELSLSSTWTPAPAYTLETGLRLEGSRISAVGSKSFVYPKPRLVFTWSPDKNDQVRVRVERAVTQLDFGAFAATGALNAGGVQAGNPTLRPEDDWIYEASYDHGFWHGGDVTVTYRRREMSHTIDRIGVEALDGTWYPEPGNIGAGHVNAIVLDLTLPLDRLGIKGGLIKTTDTWRLSTVTDPTTGQARALSDIGAFVGQLKFTQDLPRWKSTWGVTWTGPQRDIRYEFDQVVAYKTDAKVALFYDYKPTNRYDISLEADNASGHRYATVIKDFDQPRTAGARPDLLDVRTQHISPQIVLSLRYSLE